jgi:ribosome-binding protein aMBF1 (putative translation factor)
VPRSFRFRFLVLYSLFAIISNLRYRRGVRNDTLERLRERLAHVDPDQGWFFAALADQVVQQRRARELSQAELADLCGTTQSAIARLESGGRPPRIDTLLRIAEALDCELTVELRPRTRPERGSQ